MTTHPAPWKFGEGYDQNDPGYYIADANGYIVIADTEGTLTRDTALLIVALRNETKLQLPDWRPDERKYRATIDAMGKALQELSDTLGTVCFSEAKWRAKAIELGADPEL